MFARNFRHSPGYKAAPAVSTGRQRPPAEAETAAVRSAVNKKNVRVRELLGGAGQGEEPGQLRDRDHGRGQGGHLPQGAGGRSQGGRAEVHQGGGGEHRPGRGTDAGQGRLSEPDLASSFRYCIIAYCSSVFGVMSFVINKFCNNTMLSCAFCSHSISFQSKFKGIK